MGKNLIFTNDIMAAIGQINAQGGHNLMVWIADVNTSSFVPAHECVITIPDGDGNKSLDTVTHVLDEM